MTTIEQRVKRGTVAGIDSISIFGPFDFNDPVVDNLVSQILSEGKKSIAFDFSKTSYLTSQGISCLIKNLKKCQAADATLYIHGATPDMLELIRMANIDKFIQII
jgi:anti-anti-sigma factor